MLDDPKEVGPGARRRIEGDDIGAGEAEWPSQPVDKHVVDQTHLRAHHLHRRVVRPRVLAQLRVVGGEEVFVEVQPRIARPGQQDGRHHGHHPQQQIERSGHLRARPGVGQHLQGAGQQVVLCGQRGHRTVEGERVGSLATPQQQGEGHGLGVGVGELRVRRVREQKLPPVSGKLHQRRPGVRQRIGHVAAQHPAQRRQQRREAREVDPPLAVQRQDRLPGQEVAQQRLHGTGIFGPDRLPSVAGHVSREANDSSGPLAPAIECPLVPVGVEQVGDGRETPELRPVAAFEAGRVRARAGSFELDVPGQQSVTVDGVIGTPETVGQGRFARTDDALAPRRRHRLHQMLEGTAKLVLRPAPDQRGRLGGDRLGEVLQRVLDRRAPA